MRLLPVHRSSVSPARQNGPMSRALFQKENALKFTSNVFLVPEFLIKAQQFVFRVPAPGQTDVTRAVGAVNRCDSSR